mgnify:CR=1 FL=1|jgi:hypothetical protein|tara:strand:- start:14 stop:658 length:645 start_codon:yes stop_codon:yes gene_type:complete
MANSNGSFGLKPIGKIGQATNSTGMTEYRIASDNSNPIFNGMAVIPLAGGVIDDLQAAAGGNVSIVGVFGGCEYVSSTTGETIFGNYWPGSGADSDFPVKAFLYDDPNQLFTIATSNVVAAANTEAEIRAAVFANIAFATGNSGSTSTGMSSATADLNTIATTNTLALRIMGVQDDPDNADFTAAGIPLIVRINNHFNAPTGSIAAGTVSTTGV